MLDFIIFAATFLTVLIGAIIWLYPSAKNVTTIPGLTPTGKDYGNLGDLVHAGSLHEFLMEIHARFGAITGFWWGQTYTVSIASPELFKQHNSAFDRPPIFFKQFEPLIGHRSIQYANGSDGRSRRRAYDAAFSFDNFQKCVHTFEETVQKFEAKWSKKGTDDHIAVHDDCMVFAIQSALVSMFGDTFKDDKLFLKVKSAYERVWHEMEQRIIAQSPADEFREAAFEKGLGFLQSSIKDVVATRRKSDQHLQGNLLIDILIDNCEDDEMVISDAITYFVGGFHTTGNLLTWAIYFLATHKDVQSKLCKEVEKVLRDNGSVDKDNYSDFVYVHQVIDESLRCSVLAPMAARFQDFDSELGGHKIPKNTPVIHAMGVTLKDEKLWPLPNKFDPDRFCPESRKNMSSFDFVPFGFAGKRKCPGYRFAYWEAVVFLTSMVRRFDISMCEDQVVTPVYALVTSPAEEIWVTVSKRK